MHFSSDNEAFHILRASAMGAQTFDLKTGVIYLLFTLAVAAHRPQVLESPPQQDDEETPPKKVTMEEARKAHHILWPFTGSQGTSEV